MKKAKNKLSLDKFTITKLENTHQIQGGNHNSSAACDTDDSSAICQKTGTGSGTASNANKTAPPPTKPIKLGDLLLSKF